jgi:hypothetical protein
VDRVETLLPLLEGLTVFLHEGPEQVLVQYS